MGFAPDNLLWVANTPSSRLIMLRPVTAVLPAYFLHCVRCTFLFLLIHTLVTIDKRWEASVVACVVCFLRFMHACLVSFVKICFFVPDWSRSSFRISYLFAFTSRYSKLMEHEKRPKSTLANATGLDARLISTSVENKANETSRTSLDKIN
jgi:hypothetical protein